jgi:hypothetical protein
MINIKNQLKSAGKKTADYLLWLEDDRRNHDLSHLSGDLVVTEQNGGSANEISIDERLLPNFNKFLKE